MQRTIPRLFEDSVARFSGNPFLFEKLTDKYESVTYGQVHGRVYQFAAGLLSLGVAKADRIALISEGRSEWIIAELGILYAEAVNVPLSVKLEPRELKFRLSHAEVKIIIISLNQAAKIQEITGELRGIEYIIYLDQKETYAGNELYFEDIILKGNSFLGTKRNLFESTWQSLNENDPANICYTSGTSSEPKGIILSHLNYYANVEQAVTLMNIPETYRTLLILPLDHAFAHTAGIYCFMKMGAGVATVKQGRSAAESIRNIPVNIREVKPAILMSVPALARNFRINIEKGIAEKGVLTEKLFRHTLNIAYSYYGNGWNKGKGMQILKKPLVWFYDKLLFSKIRKAFGGELRFFIGGGALLDIELQRFFYAIGIPMFQGYGLTEAAPVISSNAPQKHKLGSSGFLVKNLELKICDDKGKALAAGEKGEILVKGENVMSGYWKNESATKEALQDGWLHTGDMGYMDADGFLYVLGRFKSLLIGNDGEKYSPEGIEEAMTAHSPFISQVMLHNNQDPYTVAILVPDAEAIRRWMEHQHLTLSDSEREDAVLNLIRSEINQYRPGGTFEGIFPERWLPASTGILNEAFSEQNQMINSTLKMVRGKINEHYSDLMSFLYTPEAKDICNARNRESIRSLLRSQV